MIPISVTAFNDYPYGNSYMSPYSQGANYVGNFSSFNNSNINNSADDTTKTIGLAAILQVAALGLQKASGWFAKKLTAGKEFTTPDNVKQIAGSMVDKYGLDDVHVGFINQKNKTSYSNIFNLGNSLEEVAKGQNAFYIDDLHLDNSRISAGVKPKIAVAPESKPSLILHELGHAGNAKNFFTKFLQKSRKYAGFAPTALLLANGLFATRQDGKKNFVERNAGILGFAAFLPTIVEEGMASLKGINAAKAKATLLNIKPEQLNILKRNYALALCTYIIAGLGLGIAAKQTIVENKL